MMIGTVAVLMVMIVLMMIMNFSSMSHLIVLVMAARIGAGLGLEGRLHVRYLRAQLR